MAASISSKSFLILSSRRIHFLIPDALRQQPAVSSAAASVGGETGAGRATDNKSDRRFSPWMMDPTTGFWMPESHINSEQVDPVVLKEMHLAKKK